MLNETNLHKYLWADVISAHCDVINRMLVRPILKRTPYELYKGRKSNISKLYVFGCKYFILNKEKDNLKKLDTKADEGIFLRYSTSSKDFRVFDKES